MTETLIVQAVFVIGLAHDGGGRLLGKSASHVWVYTMCHCRQQLPQKSVQSDTHWAIEAF